MLYDFFKNDISPVEAIQFWYFKLALLIFGCIVSLHTFTIKIAYENNKCSWRECFFLNNRITFVSTNFDQFIIVNVPTKFLQV